MAKNHAPLIALVVAIGVLALIGVFSSGSNKEAKAPVAEEEPIVQDEQEKDDTLTPTPSLPRTSSPSGAVTSYTVWKTFVQDDWGISFKTVDSWEVSTNDAVKDGEVNQVAIDAESFTVLVTEDIKIGEPSRISSKTYKRTIAGREVEVKEYTNPNETYAYYLFFTITVGNDDYHFSIKDRESDRTKADSFLSRVTIK